MDGQIQQKPASRALEPVLPPRLSPVHYVPVEVLEYIFSHALRLPQSRDIPVLLSHICHFWREIALSMSTLWSEIFIHIPKHPGEPQSTHLPTHSHLSISIGHQDEDGTKWEGLMERKLETLKEWLRRSRLSLLSLHVSGHTLAAKSVNGTNIVQAILSNLAKTAGRWRSLVIELEYESPRYTLSIPTISSAPFLRHLSIRGPKPGNGSTTPTVVFHPLLAALKGSTDRLACIDVQCHLRDALTVQHSLLSVPVEWSKITDLSLGGRYADSTPEQFFRVLQHCSTLIRCCLYLQYRAPSLPFHPPSHLALANLEDLTVVQYTPSFSDLFSALRLPSLQKLDFTLRCRVDLTQSSLSTLLATSAEGSPLKTVTLRGFDFTPAYLRTCLGHTPLLTHLRILSTIDCVETASQDISLFRKPLQASTVWSALSGSSSFRCGDVSPLCPALRSTTFELDIANFDPSAYAAFLRSRQRLDCLTLLLGGTRTPSEVAEKVKEIKEVGVGLQGATTDVCYTERSTVWFASSLLQLVASGGFPGMMG